jgi:hypothetical protein
MREIKKWRYVFAALLTIVVFLLGVFMSHYIDGARYDALQNQIQENNLELESRQLQLSYLRSENVESCGALKAGLQDIVSSYNKRLGNIQSYEENSFFREKDFQKMKHAYVLSGLRYWMFAEEVNDRCGREADTVLFFTTRIGNADDCDECGRMGEQLSLLKQEYNEDLLIFTVPTDMEDGLIEMLEGQFNITDIPTAVINGNKSKTVEGFKSRDQIRKHLTVSTDE